MKRGGGGYLDGEEAALGGEKAEEGVDLGEIGPVRVEPELEGHDAQVLQRLHHTALLSRILQETHEHDLGRVHLRVVLFFKYCFK